MQRAIETLRRAGMLVASGDAPVSLDARFFQRRRSSRRRGGVVADAADAAGDLRAASMRGRTSRCERPNAGQTLALLSAVALAPRVALTRGRGERRDAPADVPPRRTRAAETSDEHLTDAANGIRVRVDGHGSIDARGGRRWTPTDPTDADGLGNGPGVSDFSSPADGLGNGLGVSDVSSPADGLVSVADAAAAARDAGPGVSPRPNSRRVRARASRRARRRCARRATRETRAEVNAYTEFRYVAEAHAARFRVTHPASLDAAPPPGAAPSRRFVRGFDRTGRRTNRSSRGFVDARAARRFDGPVSRGVISRVPRPGAHARRRRRVRARDGRTRRTHRRDAIGGAGDGGRAAADVALGGGAREAEAATREAPTAHVFAPQDCAAWG